MITDPIEHIPSIADQHGWEWNTDEDGQANVDVPGDWNTYSVSLLWQANKDLLIIRSVIPARSVPALFQPELARLLNMINSVAQFGSWYHQEGDENLDYIVWRKEIHSQIEHLDEPRIVKIFTHTRAQFDMFYPAITYFLAQRVVVEPINGILQFVDWTVDAEQAMEYVSIGGAPKGRA